MGPPQSPQQPDRTSATHNEESEDVRGDEAALSATKPEATSQTRAVEQPDDATARNVTAASNPIDEPVDEEDRDRIAELRQWFRIHKNSVSAKTVLEDMTDHLSIAYTMSMQY